MPHLAIGLIGLLWAIPGSIIAQLEIRRARTLEDQSYRADDTCRGYVINAWAAAVLCSLIALIGASVTIWQWWG